ncbi:hypothetical protein B296_00058770 [Ensete ventricosum]|uniref:Uncharacterized protein n=1 Tax=Ensete ventricosum TaxID=4639 RepID=A0A426XHG5_ENSVE|nr:hypothetical protein B296_00058770 [Ensete ventricosum]
MEVIPHPLRREAYKGKPQCNKGRFVFPRRRNDFISEMHEPHLLRLTTEPRGCHVSPTSVHHLRSQISDDMPRAHHMPTVTGTSLTACSRKPPFVGGKIDRANDGPTQSINARANSATTSASELKSDPRQPHVHVGIRGGAGPNDTSQTLATHHKCRMTRHTFALYLCVD